MNNKIDKAAERVCSAISSSAKKNHRIQINQYRSEWSWPRCYNRRNWKRLLATGTIFLKVKGYNLGGYTLTTNERLEKIAPEKLLDFVHRTIILLTVSMIANPDTIESLTDAIEQLKSLRPPGEKHE